jgi:hypothetical protein
MSNAIFRMRGSNSFEELISINWLLNFVIIILSLCICGKKKNYHPNEIVQIDGLG